MPHYKIGHVDDSIAGMQRTFSCNDQSVYDFLQTVAEELECIFLFDNFSRTVNCYKLDGFGADSGVFVDGTKNLAENITVTGDKDSVKNCFKIEGGDDVITDRIGNRLIGGGYVWKFSSYQMEQMSDVLKNALLDRESLVESHQSHYNNLWDSYNKKIEQITYYQSGMMPSQKTSGETAESVFLEIFGTGGRITYGCTSNKYQGAGVVLKSIQNFAKVIAPSTYSVELTEVRHTNYSDDNSISSITFTVHVYLTDRYTKNSDGLDVLEDEYQSGEITLPVKKGYLIHEAEDNTVFTMDYFLYLKQQMDIAEEKSDITDKVISFEPPLTENTIYNSDTTPLMYQAYDNETNTENLSPIHYTMYCINRLKSFHDAYESCSQVLAGLDSNIASNETSDFNHKILTYLRPDGTRVGIYEELLGKYGRYMELIDARISYLQSKVDTLNEECENLRKQIDNIKDICDMQKFLLNYENGTHGDNLWIELCSFRRQDTYRNENYIGEGLDESTLIENVEGLIQRAEEEIEKACEVKYSISTSLENLFTMWEFQPFWDKFDLGNYIHVRIDDKIYKLRLISITYDYDDLSHISVEFSEFTRKKDCVSDVREILQQAKSMASSYNFVAKQAEKGEAANIEFNQMRENGLNIANTAILDAQNQKPLIDEYGITGRKWNDIAQTYEPEQSRWINNLLCFTDDGWKHTKCALGKIWYYDEEKGEYVCDFGLNAQVLVSDLILSKKMRIVNQSGTYIIDNNGFKMSKDGSYIMFDPNNPSIVAHNKKGEDVLDFNSDSEGNLVIKGKIDGGSINIGEGFSVDENGNMEAKGAKVEGDFTITGGKVNIDTGYDSDDSIIFNYRDNEKPLYRKILINKNGYVYETMLEQNGPNKREKVSINSNSITFIGGDNKAAGYYSVSLTAKPEGLECNKPIIAEKIYANNIPEMKSGSVTGNITAINQKVSVDVEFDRSMSTVPNVVVTPVTINPSGVSVSVTDVSKTGFTVVMSRNDGVYPLGVNWIAMC